MRIRITDISKSIGKPLLRAAAGQFATPDGTPTYQNWNLARWKITGPLTLSLSVVSYIFLTKVAGKEVWVAEVVFMDTDTASWGTWRTYQIDILDGSMIDQVEAEIRGALVSDLVK